MKKPNQVILTERDETKLAGIAASERLTNCYHGNNLPASWRTLYELSSERISNYTHVNNLPASWGTLYDLSRSQDCGVCNLLLSPPVCGIFDPCRTQLTRWLYRRI